MDATIIDNRKRPRASDNDNRLLLFRHEHCHRPETKRGRLESSSDPSMVTTATPELFTTNSSSSSGRTPSPSSVVVSETAMETPTPWWKQQPREVLRSSTNNDDCCCVCKESLDTTAGPTESTLQQRVAPQSNTLLSYFACTTTTTHTTTTSNLGVEARPAAKTCHYCCRSNICAACIAPCDACGHSYCAFCRTPDYCGTVAQTLCAECCAREEMGGQECALGRAGGAGDEDAMEIG